MRISRSRTRLTAAAATALVAGGTAAIALAAPGAPSITSAPSRWSQDPSPAFSWTSGGGGNGTFLWSLNGGPETAVTGTSVGLSGLGDGDYVFSVREDADPDPEVPDDPGDPGPADTRPFGVDRGAPSIARTFSGTPGDDGWWRSNVVVGYVCSDGLSGVAPGACPDGRTISSQTTGTTVSAESVRDRAGNIASVGAVVVKRDALDPTPAISSPGTGSVQLGGPSPVFTYSCEDNTSGVAQCDGAVAREGGAFAGRASGSTIDIGQPGTGAGPLGVRVLRVSSRDNAGNTETLERRFSVVDTIKPSPPVPGSPGGVTNLTLPTFTWQSAVDSGTGVTRYELRIDNRAPISLAAAPGEMQHKLTGGAGANAALTPGVHAWTVTAFDAAGNSSPAETQTFRVDPSAPDAPVIIDGPRGFTRTTAPAFRYSGLVNARFTWTVERGNCTETPATPTACDVQGPVADTTGAATLAPLADGPYRFKVSQANDAGTAGADAVAAFTVDTTRPGTVKVTSTPGTTADPRPTFGWTGAETGASFRWVVTGPGGNTVLGPGTSATTSVTLPSPLPGGAYVFLVRQIDQAGNEGDWSAPEPFTVVGAPAPPAPSTTGGGVRTAATPRTVNARKLTPRAGSVLRTLRPTLRWARYPRATLYNVQIFRVRGTSSVKVLSAFPRGTRYVVPRGKLKAGQRYVWRVWPYVGRLKRYTRTPLGMTYFDTHRTARTPRTARR